MKIKTFATSRSPFVIFFLIAAVAIIYIFYRSPVRDHVESYLYDIRTVLKPKNQVDDIVIIAIDEPSIAVLAPPESKNIAYPALLDLTEKILKSEAREVIVMAFSNIFSNESPEVEDLKALVLSQERLTVGTLGLYNNSPSGIDLPGVFEDIDDRVYGVDALRKRSNSVVRWLPLFGYQGQTLKALLPYYIAKKTLGTPILKEGSPEQSDDRDQELSWYMVNYTSQDKFHQIRAMDYAADPDRYRDDLAGKIVLLGYTAYREWPTQTREPMVANTPLQGQVDTYKGGAPLIYLAANSIHNLIHHAWLEPAPAWVNFVQVVLVSLLLSFIWVFGVVPATIGIFMTWLILLFGHGYIFEYAHRFIPLGDTALFSSFALILGALWRLNSDVKAQTEIRAKTEAKAELAALQSSFLDRFAFELAAVNDELFQKMKDIDPAGASSDTGRSLLHRALASSEDFSEYLEGIKQSAAVEGRDLHRPQKVPVIVRNVIAAILPRFETKIEDKKLQIAVNCPYDLRASSDAKILDTIIYNLLSNAIKYAPKESPIDIIARVVSPTKILITVRDEGPGIAQENLEKIFEKFYRVKDENVYSVKGTGLGLYLCRYFAAQIDARVWCEAILGSGTCFFLEVERAKT